MADYGFPFPAIDDDRMYSAADWAAYFEQFISNGVFPIGSQLQVTAGSGMQVNVSAGAAWINGYGRVFNTAYVLGIDPADGVLNRVDCIVVRWGRVERNVYLYVLKGTPASNPTAPALTRDADYYDLCLAEISVNAGIIGIAAAHISDNRLNPDLCGIVSSIITPDTAGWYEGWETEFQTWFAHIKGLLADDPATALAAAVATLESEMETAQADIDALENAATARTTAGTAPNFTVADPTVTGYYIGMRRTIIAHADSGVNPTLNFNGKGAKAVLIATGKAAKWSAGQHVVVEDGGTNFFIVSAGGGAELPGTIGAGNTVVLMRTDVFTTSSTTFVDLPNTYAFTVNISGTYRIFFVVNNAGNAITTQAQFTKNGIAVAESTVSTGNYATRKTTDVVFVAGDVIRMQARTNSKSGESVSVAFSPMIVSILAPDIQTELSKAITPLA